MAGDRHLLTGLAASNNVVHGVSTVGADSCATVYTPPAGKAIVLTEVTYDLGSGTAGNESYAILGCTAGYFDYADTTAAYYRCRRSRWRTGRRQRLST